MEINGIHEKVIKATTSVFENMVRIQIKGEAYHEPIRIEERHLTAMVGFAGTYVGLAAIHCTERFARRVGGAMLMMDADALTDEDVRDALGEISNMIGGHFKAQLAELFQTDSEIFKQSVPSVICGQNYETHAVTDVPSHCVIFHAENEDFFVELALKKV